MSIVLSVLRLQCAILSLTSTLTLTLIHSFAQAIEILPKINTFEQYYLRKQELTSARCSCNAVYSSAQWQLVFRHVRHFLGL